MRLDHLLSKEHLGLARDPGPLRRQMFDGGQLMGGTLTIRHTESSEVSTASAWKVSGGLSGSGTLLGSQGMVVCFLECWLFENCIVDASICGQVFKGARWMPWHQEPMKDVGGHDRPRGVVNQALIRGCPNGETRQSSWAVTHT